MNPRRAFTLIELIIVLVVVIVLVAVFLVPALGISRVTGRQLKDSRQLRVIHQGLTLAVPSSGDIYPFPSALDKAHETLPDSQPKDLPRHIISLLIYNGHFSPELCVSPVEATLAIRPYDAYQYAEPAAAAGDKKLALWDPAFKATPLDADTSNNTAKVGNVSYAMMPPMGARKKLYANTFQANEAILGNRGPGYTGGGQADWTLMPNAPTSTTPGGAGSNSLLFHRGRSTWEGNIAYNDNHVNFETRPDPETLPFTFGSLPVGKQKRFDNLFVNENDQTRLPDAETLEGTAANNTNNFLRLWYDATVTDGKMTAIKPWYD